MNSTAPRDLARWLVAAVMLVAIVTYCGSRFWSKRGVVSSDGPTVLHAVSQGRSDEFIRGMIYAGARVRAGNGGYTPLMEASFQGKYSTVELLLRADAVPTHLMSDRHMSSPLVSLVRGKSDDVRIAQRLFSAGDGAYLCDGYEPEIPYSSWAQSQRKPALASIFKAREAKCSK